MLAEPLMNSDCNIGLSKISDCKESTYDISGLGVVNVHLTAVVAISFSIKQNVRN